jgi:ComF family protein
MSGYSFSEIIRGFIHLVFPHNCACCGSDILAHANGICASCLHELPETGFLNYPGNAVEKIFWGRLDITHAAAAAYFTKQSVVQQVLHHVKYKAGKGTGLQLGRWMGYRLKECNWFNEIDCLLPMPLHKKRIQERGYNQCDLLCEGISSVTGIRQIPGLLIRREATNSQTKQHRTERWKNMQGVFEVDSRNLLQNRHVLLVDDVVTTGATLEAMGRELLAIQGLKLSIYCFAYTLPL